MVTAGFRCTSRFAPKRNRTLEVVGSTLIGSTISYKQELLSGASALDRGVLALWYLFSVTALPASDKYIGALPRCASFVSLS